MAVAFARVSSFQIKYTSQLGGLGKEPTEKSLAFN